MARLNPERIEKALEEHLPEAEQVKASAYAIRRPGFLVRVAFGSIGVALLKKKYIVAVTDENFIVARFVGRLKIQSVDIYPLNDLPEFSVFTSFGAVHFRIKTVGATLKLVCGRRGMRNNLDHARRVAETLQNTQLFGAVARGIDRAVRAVVQEGLDKALDDSSVDCLTEAHSATK